MRLQSPQLRAVDGNRCINYLLRPGPESYFSWFLQGGYTCWGGGPMCRHVYSTQLRVNICRNIYICVSVGVKAPS